LAVTLPCSTRPHPCRVRAGSTKAPGLPGELATPTLVEKTEGRRGKKEKREDHTKRSPPDYSAVPAGCPLPFRSGGLTKTDATRQRTSSRWSRLPSRSNPPAPTFKAPLPLPQEISHPSSRCRPPPPTPTSGWACGKGWGDVFPVRFRTTDEGRLQRKARLDSREQGRHQSWTRNSVPAGSKPGVKVARFRCTTLASTSIFSLFSSSSLKLGAGEVPALGPAGRRLLPKTPPANTLGGPASSPGNPRPRLRRPRLTPPSPGLDVQLAFFFFFFSFRKSIPEGRAGRSGGSPPIGTKAAAYEPLPRTGDVPEPGTCKSRPVGFGRPHKATSRP